MSIFKLIKYFSRADLNIQRFTKFLLILAKIELPDQGDNIIRTKDFEYEPDPKGLAYELYTCLKKNPSAIAQKDAETEETDTYETYAGRIIRVALHLRKRGITPDDVIVPCTTVHMNAGVTFIGTILSGAKVACIDPNIAYIDAEAQINLIKPKIMIISPDSVEWTEQIIKDLDLKTEIVVFGETKKHTPFSEFLKPLTKEEEANFEPYIPKNLFEVPLVVFSSGSTGVPKGICIHQYAILSQLKRLMAANTSARNSLGISYASLAWATAQWNVFTCILSTTCNLLCRDFTVEKTWKYLVKYNVGHLVLSPHNCMVMFKHGNPQKIETPDLKVIGVGGGKISQTSANGLAKTFLNTVFVIHGYAQTEIYGIVLLPKGKNIGNVDCLGDPATGYWYKVVDPETGKICGPNEQGEMYIKSKFVMSGYYNQDSSDRFDEQGYLKTGDVVYYDEDHSFFFVERYREALRYKGYWIAPTYLESLLYQHPAVKIACVIGIPTDDGDLPTAVVVKADNAQDVTDKELVKYIDEQVTELKKLRGGVIFVDESLVEFTPSGKLRRYFLRKKVLEQLGYKTD